MPTLKLIILLLPALMGGFVMSLLFAFTLFLIGVLLLLPGGLGILFVEWERVKEWLLRAVAHRRPAKPNENSTETIFKPMLKYENARHFEFPKSRRL